MELREEQVRALHYGSLQEAAQTVLELPSFQLASQALNLLRTHPLSQAVLHRLRHILTVAKEHIYVHPNYLTRDRLRLITQLFRTQPIPDPVFFRQDCVYVLLAVAKGFLSQPGVDGEGVRQCFGRGLRKEGSFWGLAELEDLQAWVVDRTAGKFCRWDADRHEQELGRIEYLLAFLEQHWSLFPGGGEEWSQMFKLSLCLREDREADRRLLGRVVEGLQQHRYHAQITLRNMKFLLEFFRHPLNEKECQYYPQRSGATLLANYSEEEIENFLSKSAIGMEWDSPAVQSYFLACVKMGITAVTAKLIVAMIRYCLRTSKTAELLAAYELNLTKIFIFMKHSKFFTPSLTLLKFFLLGPPPTHQLLLKLMEKAHLFALNVLPDQKYPYFNFLQAVAYHYRQLPDVSHLQQIIDDHIGPSEVLQAQSEANVNRLSAEELKRQIEEFSWKVKVVSNKGKRSGTKQALGLRGLTNIGNSCYLNSFLQSLFMTREFARFILQASTLELSRSLTKPHLASLSPELLSKKIRDDLKPLFEVQKLFALLLKSKRSEINPLIVRNISLQMFRNSYQHDSIEFGRSLLDQLSCSGAAKLFEGEVTTGIDCGYCGVRRQRKEVFLDYIIAPQSGQEDLQQLYNGTFNQEVIANLTCDHCEQSSSNSIKRHWISQFPKYLILTIKRFQYDTTEKKNRKVMSKINFSNQLRVQNDDYELYSLIVHRGHSPNAGHYFSFSKTGFEENDKWVCHNDSVVTAHQSFQQIASILENNESDTPYILFYYLKKHIGLNKQLLSLPLVLRPPQEEYVIKQDSQSQKEQKKQTKMPLFDVFSLMKQFRKDQDEQDPRGSDFFNNPIV